MTQLTNTGTFKVDKQVAIQKLRTDLQKLSSHLVSVLVRGVLYPIVLPILVLGGFVAGAATLFGTWTLLVVPCSIILLPMSYCVGCFMLNRDPDVALDALGVTWKKMNRIARRLDLLKTEVDDICDLDGQ